MAAWKELIGWEVQILYWMSSPAAAWGYSRFHRRSDLCLPVVVIVVFLLLFSPAAQTEEWSCGFTPSPPSGSSWYSSSSLYRFCSGMNSTVFLFFTLALLFFLVLPKYKSSIVAAAYFSREQPKHWGILPKKESCRAQINILLVVVLLAATLLHPHNPLQTNCDSLSLARPTPQYAAQGRQDVLSATTEAADSGLRRRRGHVTSMRRYSSAPPDATAFRSPRTLVHHTAPTTAGQFGDWVDFFQSFVKTKASGADGFWLPSTLLSWRSWETVNNSLVALATKLTDFSLFFVSFVCCGFFLLTKMWKLGCSTVSTQHTKTPPAMQQQIRCTGDESEGDQTCSWAAGKTKTSQESWVTSRSRHHRTLRLSLQHGARTATKKGNVTGLFRWTASLFLFS